MKTNLEIYISCYKKDFFLTKICVASIRYYYPKIKIYLIKDEICGKFSTTELEQKFRVEVANLGTNNFGWTTAKMFLLLSPQLKNKKILVLDSDIIFVGRVLNKLEPYLAGNDFIVSPESKDRPGSRRFNRYYYNCQYFSGKYPELRFPEFTFNSGNIVITGGKISPKEISEYFTKKKFPYWTDFGLEKLPSRDQSLLNFLLPLKAEKKQISLEKVKFMHWYLDKEVVKISLDEVSAGTHQFLIHYAGAPRETFLPSATRGDLLIFFKKFYYSKLTLGRWRFYLDSCFQTFKHYLK